MTFDEKEAKRIGFLRVNFLTQDGGLFRTPPDFFEQEGFLFNFLLPVIAKTNFNVG